MSKEFKTTNDLLRAVIFINNVEAVVKELQTNRLNRPIHDGLRCKRNGIDELEETGNFHTTFFLGEFGAVLAKTSTQSKRVRELIQHVGGIALHRTREHYANIVEIKEEPNKKKAKTVGHRKVNRKDPE